MLNVLIVVIVAAILVGIVAYIRREKKRGAACIGCPYSHSCGKGGCCG